uniref:TRI10 protein n=1 Tax=Trichoderma brevicompactum TaxID=247546 RepID=G0LP01_9HYPO|nr:TRI10 protein [Trichoderma brevicompactum]
MILPKRTQEKEISLLMHYLDGVFPLQFPFHERRYVGKREWLLTILASTRPVYYATLSLSLLHKEACLHEFEAELAEIWQKEKMRYYILALQESQQQLDALDTAYGIAKMKGNIHALASTLQLISFESSSLSKGDWQLHLRAGTSLIPVLIDGWAVALKSDKVASSSSLWTELDASDFNATHDEDSLSYEYVGALKFFANVLAMFGIFSLHSIGPSSPFMEYRFLMDQGRLIQMDQMMGCRNWVMLAILEIGTLDKWKREEQENRRLSLKALTSRAMAIEGVLESGLREASGSALVDLITSIYATSALTYLHTVVSGLNPNLSEVQESVAATIVLLKRLPDLRAAKSLVWPLGVTGCMASRSQEDFFRGLIISAGATPRALRNCWGLIKVWEDTWKMREYMSKQPPERWEEVVSGQGPPMLLM